MIGRLNTKEKKVTVIGGGISGLLAAYYLHRHGYEVTLLEKQKQAGGLIDTIMTPYGLAEKAAHSFLATPSMVSLAQGLGLKLLRAQTRTRYILRDGQLKRMPLSPKEAFHAVWRFLFSRAQSDAQTFAQWAKEHLNESAMNYLLNPFLLGIFGATAENISVKAAFPRLATFPGERVWDALRRTPKKREKTFLAAFEKGTGSLVKALSQDLTLKLGKNFVLGKAVEELPRSGNVVLCVPAYEAARLLQKKHKALARALEKVNYNPFVQATVFLEKRAEIPKGVGVLIPPLEKRKILGVLFNSHTFAYRTVSQELHSVSVFAGGSLFPEIVSLKESEIREIIEEELAALFHARKYIRHMEIVRWHKGIPLYNEDLRLAWDIAEKLLAQEEGLILFGNYTGEISLRGLEKKASQLGS